MGIFSFLQSVGSLGQMIRNVIETYTKFKSEPAESDLERFIAMAIVRYAHPSIPDGRAKRGKVLGNMIELIERGEPVGLFGYCSGVAWAEMDVNVYEVEAQKNILKIIRREGVSYNDAFGKKYEEEEFHRLLRKLGL